MAPAALVFREEEDILTLGAIIAAKLFEKPVAILRLPEFTYDALSKAKVAEIYNDNLSFLDQSILLLKPNTQNLQLVASDLNIIKGHDGQARKIAIEVICLMASVQGATELIDVSRGHIDGCKNLYSNYD